MPLSENQKRQLRKLGHNLKPVVMLGSNGLTEAVQSEIIIALEHHELIKVRLGTGDRDIRKQMIADITKQNKAELVQQIGHVAVIFRRNREAPKITFQ